MSHDGKTDVEIDDAVAGAIGAAPAIDVPALVLDAIDGKQTGTRWRSVGERLSIGSHPSNDVHLDDRLASRFHCEITIDKHGARVRDRESTNGTFVAGVRVVEAWLASGSLVRVGKTTLRFTLADERLSLPLAPAARFGGLVGRSVAMRRVFALLEAYARAAGAVLIEGESGTGKDRAAEVLHSEGPRAQGPFVVVDCGSISAGELEAELFGAGDAAGAVEAAHGGTLFLDRVGELPPPLQLSTLRLLEDRTARRTGTSDRRPVDVRVVAATHRHLREEVNEGRFRADLYYRLAVMNVVMPPLRAHLEDVPLLVRHLLERLGADDAAREKLTDPELLRRLQRSDWPGNVRELANYMEGCLAVREELPLSSGASAVREHGLVDAFLPYSEAKRRALADFTRRYVSRLLEIHGDNVSRAAAAAGIDPVYLHRLLRRYLRDD